MKGKDKCRILKDIRRSIAEANGIEYATEDCRHKGECKGTCPKCEAELAYLERELEKKQRLGRAVTVAGLALSIGVSMTGCIDLPSKYSSTDGDIAVETQSAATDTESTKDTEKTTQDTVGSTDIPGEIAPGTEPEIEIMGDMPPIEYDGDIPLQ